MTLIDPRFMNAVEWCNRVTGLLAASVRPMTITREEEWKEWATNVYRSPRISDLQPPNPEYFSDWREWAERLTQSLIRL